MGVSARPKTLVPSLVLWLWFLHKPSFCLGVTSIYSIQNQLNHNILLGSAIPEKFKSRKQAKNPVKPGDLLGAAQFTG
jgi:hypothetical protein